MNGDYVPAEGPVSPPAPEPYPFWGYGDLVLLIGLMLPALIAAAVLVKLAALAFPGASESPAVIALAVQFLGYGLWFLCLYGALRLRYGRPFWKSLAWTRPPGGTSRFLLIGVILAIGVAVLGAALRTPDVDMPMKELLRDRVSLILVGIFAITLGPLCEELIFRGFLLPLLVKSLGAVAGVAITAVGFSLLHGPQYAWSWQHLALITVAGAVFGWIRLASGSTAAAAVMHAGYNLTFFIAFLAQGKEFPG
ncbi:MAG: CPBP family intramembrane metalloprotease [Bryobacteraceae bacterium]|nr:CPBP family intramembrane metalloprotease [Bryobacteraceae bacterium]